MFSSSAPAAYAPPSTLARVASGVGRTLAWVGFFACYAFLYAPLVTIVAFSFNDSESQALPISDLTTRWYGDLLDDEQIHEALRQSLIVALGAVAIAAVAGTAFAFIFDRVRTRTATVIQGALTVPFLLPGMVLGLSLAITFRAAGISSGRLTVMLGHATFVTPVVMLIVLARLRRLDPSYAQASMDLGANRLRTFLHVTFPQIRTALIVACLLGFTLSFDEIIVTFFLVGSSPTLPVFVWNQLRFGFTPEINAIFSVIGLVSLVLIVAATQILRRDLRRASRDAKVADTGLLP